MSRRTFVLSTIAAGLASFAIAFAIAAMRPRARVGTPEPRPSASASGGLPVLWQVPSFSFVDQDGKATTAASLRGHVWIADFVFTSCTTICPLITAKMVLLQRRLQDPALRFVSFSVDPARDTPSTLKSYAANWRPGESRWTLLAPDAPGLEAFAKSMFVIVEPGEKDIGHSKLFFLVDDKGGVRGIYESDRDDALERLVRDARTLGAAAPPPTTTAAAGSDQGKELYTALGCGACHARPELAPPLEGLVGRRVKLAGGGDLVADAGYVRESIVSPDAKLVAGHVLRMPSYASDLSAAELDALAQHVASLKANPAKPVAARASGSATPTATASATAAAEGPVTPAEVVLEEESATEPAVIARDPVCSMDVRVTAETPRASHGGRTAYFCSATCRDRFIADPERYATAAKP